VTPAARPLRFLALSGSLRARSTNTALLEAARLLSPPGTAVELYAGLADLPSFNPDLDDGVSPLPHTVATLRAQVGGSDALIIACPEYARGIPGAFKNALDWLVGGAEFPGKPIALFHATARGSHVRASLQDVLTTMSGRVMAEACLVLPLTGLTTTARSLAAEPATAAMIRSALVALAGSLS
jgi:chromate reductase, NAD(P)H dehydrogenase (quinone)